MAGGRGSRLGINVEKPLLPILGRPMIKRVIRALQESKYVSKIFVTVSRWTPNTRSVVRDLGVAIIETRGLGYVNDLKEALSIIWLEQGLRDVVVVGSDLPLLNGRIVDEVVERYLASGKEALTVVVKKDDYEKLGFKSDYHFELNGILVVPVGLNVLRADLAMCKDLLDEVKHLSTEVESLVNVNTINEAKKAEELLRVRCSTTNSKIK